MLTCPLRDVSPLDVATNIVRRREWRGQDRWICVGEDVSRLCVSCELLVTRLPSSEDENTDAHPVDVHGHVNSISVLRSYRRLGLARRLMMLSREFTQA